ncbi:hypothetical protein AGLY_008345 [Aphis glycines]|uniref:Uncharacterized protein n=1 Tax=Aphis glycines TaxID=307491 RepID=A0A6G0TMT9_APHGL|nr:hypothetical protein AGLY_008345 [Aphis glycines]
MICNGHLIIKMFLRGRSIYDLKLLLVKLLFIYYIFNHYCEIFIFMMYTQINEYQPTSISLVRFQTFIILNYITVNIIANVYFDIKNNVNQIAKDINYFDCEEHILRIIITTLKKLLTNLFYLNSIRLYLYVLRAFKFFVSVYKNVLIINILTSGIIFVFVCVAHEHIHIGHL